jgi:hypothetical protein
MAVTFLSDGAAETVVVFEVVESTGLFQTRASYTGDSNFIIELLTADGSLVDILANEIGDATIDNIIQLEPGIYLANVTGDGTWMIDFVVYGEIREATEFMPTATATTEAPTATSVPPTATARPVPAVAEMGVEKVSGHWTFKLYDVKRVKAVWFFGDPEAAQGVWFIPFVEMRNNSTGTLAPSDNFNFYIEDEAGNVYELWLSDGVLGTAHQFTTGHYYDDIQPGSLLGISFPVDTPPEMGAAWLRVEEDPAFEIYLGRANEVVIEDQQ